MFFPAICPVVPEGIVAFILVEDYLFALVCTNILGVDNAEESKELAEGNAEHFTLTSIFGNRIDLRYRQKTVKSYASVICYLLLTTKKACKTMPLCQ